MNNDRVMDVLNILGFMMGVLNYSENIDQSILQKTAGDIMQDIHMHLSEQDKKIDKILRMLEKEE